MIKNIIISIAFILFMSFRGVYALNIDNIKTFVEETYTFIFEREVDQEGLKYYVNSLNNKKLGGFDFLLELGKSDEFKNKANNLGLLYTGKDSRISNNKSNISDIEMFVREMYTFAFGRQADLEGLNYYVGRLQSGELGAFDFLVEVGKSNEFKQKIENLGLVYTLIKPVVNQAPKSNIKTKQTGSVYWTPNGKSYHTTNNCTTLKRSKVIRTGTKSQSGKNDPCNLCY